MLLLLVSRLVCNFARVRRWGWMGRGCLGRAVFGLGGAVELVFE